MVAARLVMPHQLFVEHLDAPQDGEGTLMVLVEPDLFFRQYRFHTHKLVLHRASMTAFEAKLADAGFTTAYVASEADRGTDAQLTALLKDRGVTEISCFDVVDDWLERDLRRVAGTIGADLELLETPGFLTTREQVLAQFGDRQPRMATFYEWQRRRLDVLMDGDGTVGGKWSYDADNRKALPKDLEIPDMPRTQRRQEVTDAIAWVSEEFADNPGDPETFSWPVTHEVAERWLTRFCADRLELFGPYEDAIAADETWIFHSALSPLINTGLLDPRRVVDAVVSHAEANDVPLSSLEGFVRQVIGWREYMRGAYVARGREMRTRNMLRLSRSLDEGWWTGETGLDPVDRVIERILETGYAHHIERLMILGNAMLLLRIDPDEVYEWFMEMFVDAYDWVMVPNVYAMSQFAVGELITTKPYVSGSNYVRKMSDFGKGDWATAWDALYWQFVDDHRDAFASNPRTAMTVRTLDKMKSEKREAHAEEAKRWLER